jgi:1,2-diacylglycerol 3-alpha-glucosyltransferase
MHRTYRVAMVGACPFPTAQGSQVLLKQLSEALVARGHEVHVVTYHLGDTPPTSPLGMRVHRIPRVPGYHKAGSGPAWGKIVLDTLLLILLARVVYREVIDVIHAHNYEALLVSWLVGRIMGRPVVYHSHNVMAAELPTYFRHAWARRLAGWLAHLLDHQLPRRADACVVLSSEAVSFYGACGVPKERIRLIPPGIAFDGVTANEPATVRLRYGLGEGPLVIYTGNLDQYQRLDLLLRSFRRVLAAQPTAQLVIASHSSPAECRELVGWMNQSQGKVRFIHCQSFAEMQTLLRVADIAVCPRIACFGFPIKLLNYMAAGKAVVVAQGSAKGIRHLKNGYVVQDGEEALAEGVIRLIQDPDLAGSLGIAARATVEGRFQWVHVVREIERCYDHLTIQVTEPVLADGQLI